MVKVGLSANRTLPRFGSSVRITGHSLVIDLVT